jgi:hypothetical protein
MKKIIIENKREIVLIIFGLIGGVALSILDYRENGFGTIVFAGPILMLGLVIVPAVTDIVKKYKKSDK